MSLGKRIKRARLACGMKQEEVAQHFGTSKQSVSQWERDDTRPDIGRLAQLATLFNVSCHYLVAADDREPDDLDRLISRLEKLHGEARKVAALLFDAPAEPAAEPPQPKIERKRATS